MPLEFRAGVGRRSSRSLACTAQVVDRTKIEVLYYQGALEWGYRYLLAALEGDPSFHMTSILNPSLDVQMTVGSRGHAVLPDLPDDARALRPFQIVVLAHVFADRLSDRQQRALAEYARGGGGVLFIAPDTEATQRFRRDRARTDAARGVRAASRVTAHRGRSRAALPRTDGGRGRRRRTSVRRRAAGSNRCRACGRSACRRARARPRRRRSSATPRPPGCRSSATTPRCAR